MSSTLQPPPAANEAPPTPFAAGPATSIGTVFISHKHKDKAIARIVAQYLRKESGNRARVFLSSDPQFDGPRAGGNLDEELCRAIGDSGVAILVYTGMSAELDWSYCIYECARATGKGIRLIVIQCGDEAPAPFQNQVRILGRHPEDVLKFAQDFMTSTDFFRGQREKVTNYNRNDEEVSRAGRTLHAELVAAIDESLSAKPQEWSPWKWMRLRLPGRHVAAIRDAEPAARVEQTGKAIQDGAVVVDSLSADQIFGVGIDAGQGVGHLLESWKQARPKDDSRWVEALCEQVSACVMRQFPTLRDVRIREAMTLSSVIPVVTRVLAYPGNGDVELDIYFYDVRPVSPEVEDVMIARNEMYFRSVGRDGSSGLSLQELFSDMKSRNMHRLPILDAEGRVEYMIHRSVIGEVIAAAALNGRDVSELSLATLLEDPERQRMFESTFVFVSPRTTVEEAREALRDLPASRDVFVTANGKAEEAVMGMLTNIDLQQN